MANKQVPNGSQSQSQTGSPFPDAPAALRNFSMSQKEKALEELVRDGWLSSTPDGNIGLGIRSFLDLRSWFRHNEIPACEVCNEAGVKVWHLLFALLFLLSPALSISLRFNSLYIAH